MNKINYVFLFLLSITQSCVTYSMQESEIEKAKKEECKKQFKDDFAVLFKTAETVKKDPEAFESYVGSSYYDKNNLDFRLLKSAAEYQWRPTTLIGLWDVATGIFPYGCLFHELLETGNREGIQLLTRCKYNLDRVSTNTMTPLAFLILNKHYEIAHYLIDAGADINAQSKSEKSALRLALACGNQELVKKFIASPQFKPELIEHHFIIHGNVYNLVLNAQQSKQEAPQVTVQNLGRVSKLLSKDDENWDW